MTAFMLRHLGQTEKFNELVESIKADPVQKQTFIRIVTIGILYFKENPVDLVDLKPIIYIQYDPVLVDMAQTMLSLIS